MTDGGVKSNEDILRELSEGKSFLKVNGEDFTAGSRTEGLAVGGLWGHGHADWDEMRLCGGDLAVYVLSPGQLPPENATLVYTPHACPPGYSRLQVLHKARVLEAIVKASYRSNLSVSAPEVKQCVFREGSKLWLNSRYTLEVMQRNQTEAISGPAGQSHGGLIEHVFSLVCSSHHPTMASYKERPRKNWPYTTMLDALVKQPMLLVMVGPKDVQDSHHMFRISWSIGELLLISSLALWIKQGYVCFKYTFKSRLESLRAQYPTRDGRSRVGSYHLKMVFLRHLEEHPPQQEGCPFQLMLDLCQDLQHYLLMACLPHYFWPQCDLLRTVEDNERQCALKAVEQIIADPLRAILHSPTEPKNIYGPNSPDDMRRCFITVSSLPSCPVRRECLRRPLRCLDDHRECLYLDQLKRDGRRVSGRPGLVWLANYLQK